MHIILHLRHILVGTRVTTSTATTANDALASELNQKKKIFPRRLKDKSTIKSTGEKKKKHTRKNMANYIPAV